MPDNLFKRAKSVAAERRTTLRMLMVDALERSLNEPSHSFLLRDAAVGTPTGAISSEMVNQAIDEQRDRPFNP